MGGQNQTLARNLGLFDITMIGVGAMIGAGIFVLTGEAAGVSGPSLILVFALNGVVSIITAMVYAELGSAIPEAGGGYLWIKEGLPGANAFLSGWMSWFAHAVAGSLYALGFGAFVYGLLIRAGVSMEWLGALGAPLKGLGIDLPAIEVGKKLFGVVIVVIFALINFRGASETGKAGSIVTVAKLVVIGAFCLFGLKFMFFPNVWPTMDAGGGMGTEQLQPLIPGDTGWLGIASAMGLTFIAFEGYEIIVQAGEEVKNPRRNIPRAVFLSLAIVVPVYMLVAFVLVGASQTGLLIEAQQAIGHSTEGLTASDPNWTVLGSLGELGLAEAASQFVPYGGFLILIGGVLSTMSALNATTFSSTRVSFAMGRDNNLPGLFAKVHGKRRTPHGALSASALLMLMMVVFVPLTTVAAAADIMFLLLFLQVNIAVITIRRKYGTKLKYNFLLPFYPLTPILGIGTLLLLAVIMFVHYAAAWGYVAGWLAIGGVLYYFYARKREAKAERPPIVLGDTPINVPKHAVLVAVGEPEDSKQMVELGQSMAAMLDGELLLMHDASIPHQLPASAAREFIETAQEVVEQAAKQADKSIVNVRAIVRVARRPSAAIISTARDYQADYLIMSRRERFKREKGVFARSGRLLRTVVLGHNIDQVIRDANSHSIVLETGMGRPAKLLVPIANPNTASLAIGVAVHLAGRQTGARVTVLHISERQLSDEEKDKFRKRIERDAEETEDGPAALFRNDSPLQLEFVVSADVAGELAKRSADVDAIVMGTSRGGLFRSKVFGRLPTQVAARSACPVVFVRMRESGVVFSIRQFVDFFRHLEESGEPEEDQAKEETSE